MRRLDNRRYVIVNIWLKQRRLQQSRQWIELCLNLHNGIWITDGKLVPIINIFKIVSGLCFSGTLNYYKYISGCDVEAVLCLDISSGVHEPIFDRILGPVVCLISNQLISVFHHGPGSLSL